MVCAGQSKAKLLRSHFRRLLPKAYSIMHGPGHYLDDILINTHLDLLQQLDAGACGCGCGCLCAFHRL